VYKRPIISFKIPSTSPSSKLKKWVTALCVIFLTLVSLENVTNVLSVVARLPLRLKSTFIEIFSHSAGPSLELLCSKKIQETLILAFEANSALSRENETKIVKITHSAPSALPAEIKPTTTSKHIIPQIEEQLRKKGGQISRQQQRKKGATTKAGILAPKIHVMLFVHLLQILGF
jgi:hypothetical protein